MKVAVVMNPTAGGGRMARRWPAFAAAFASRFGSVTVEQTAHSGDGEAAARRLAAAGADIVVAAGGDGTASEVANGLLGYAAETGAGAALGVIPVGSGLDFATALQLPVDPAACAKAIAERPARRIDAGRIRFNDDEGRHADRYFVSVASLGLSGMVDRAVNGPRGRWNRLLPGRIMFLLHALRAFATYRFPDVAVAVDGARPVGTGFRRLVTHSDDRRAGRPLCCRWDTGGATGPAS